MLADGYQTMLMLSTYNDFKPSCLFQAFYSRNHVMSSPNHTNDKPDSYDIPRQMNISQREAEYSFIPLSLRQTWAEGKGLTAGMKNCLRLKASVGMVIEMRHNGFTHTLNSQRTHPPKSPPKSPLETSPLTVKYFSEIKSSSKNSSSLIICADICAEGSMQMFIRQYLHCGGCQMKYFSNHHKREKEYETENVAEMK